MQICQPSLGHHIQKRNFVNDVTKLSIYEVLYLNPRVYLINQTPQNLNTVAYLPST